MTVPIVAVRTPGISVATDDRPASTGKLIQFSNHCINLLRRRQLTPDNRLSMCSNVTWAIRLPRPFRNAG